ncbi:ABC transporter ATP-binding protein [Amycolatopsis sp. NPDC026612]|uniref:ABC transporter ATP-binding protein n=1 Tax=Amycolatopsis sp. NPDC026612 TaxID=3155466 RepID=UPI0033CC4736
MTVPGTHPPAALEVDGLSAGYGQVAVLREVSVVVPAGAVVALIGANGAGKTTLLRAVSGLLPVRAGQIRLAGRDVTRERAQRRFSRGLCHVPEGRGVFRGLTVRENLVLQGAAGREDEAIERAVAAFPILGERLGQQAGTLSGGQQQMLAMAAAYVRNPDLVLVDEASLGLAPIVVDEIFGFLRQRAADGTALLIVDQFARRALAMAGYAYVLRRGRIVHGGPAAELLDSDLFASYLGGHPD